jgi:uncharacterized protein
MITRSIQKSIENAIDVFPVVGILGSRQVGKTTLAKEIQKKIDSSVYLDLELPSDFNKLENSEYFLQSVADKLVIIDEIQRKPELFPLLRALVDQNRKPGRFIILGSSSPDLIRNASDSLAGRINYFELTPFLFDEIKSSEISFSAHWLEGGYPLSVLAENNELSFEWRFEFIRTFLEKDIPNLGLRISPVQLRRFWTMLAHSHGSIWNASKIAASLGISAPTVKNYLDVLEDTFIVRQLNPFFPNVKKRIVKSPKIYLRDSGLLHSLLNIKTEENLLSNPIAGHSWEGYVIEEIINKFHKNVSANFYRTGAGAEIDLVLSESDKPIMCCEVKFSLSPSISKSFRNALEDLKCDKAFIIYPGKDDYELAENIKVVPFNKLDMIFSE